jgi:DNA polymerase (family 10)
VLNSLNLDIAARFDEVAQLLAEQGASRYRVEAYRRGAETLRGLARPVSDILRDEGVAGLERLPAIGEAGLPRARRCCAARRRLRTRSA